MERGSALIGSKAPSSRWSWGLLFVLEAPLLAIAAYFAYSKE